MANRNAASVSALALALTVAGGERAAAQDLSHDSASSASASATTADKSSENLIRSGDAAASASDAGEVGDIIVTAQRRAERLSRVGVTVTAVGAEQLAAQGINDPTDLVKVVPGFQVASSTSGSPVYTLRGVGFNAQNVSATSPVGLYSDEATIPFAYMTLGTLFDLERVEVLKGPQGTLYGRNATGGLINFVSAKPTATLRGGVNLELGNFKTVNASAFVSGPISDWLRVRLAVDVQNRFAGWQRSVTRDERLGELHQKAARLSLSVGNGGPFDLALTGTYWRREGDTLAPQAIVYLPDRPTPSAFAPSGARASIIPHPTRNTQADFLSSARQPQADIGIIHPSPLIDSEFYAISGRASYQLADQIRLVSLTNYNHLRQRDVVDAAGLQVESIFQDNTAHIKSFAQELRLLGETERFNWSIGAYYAQDKSRSEIFGYADENATIRRLRAIAGSVPQTRYAPAEIARSFGNFRATGADKTEVRAAFANADYKVNDLIKLTLGARYTRDSVEYTGCTYDNGGRNAPVVNIVYPLLIRRTVNLQPNKCYILNRGSTDFIDLVKSMQVQNNFAWRANLEVTPDDKTLLYASVSRGYKAGGFPVLAGSNEIQYLPIRQERLTAYEVGTKLSLADSKIQLNASAFYYDYVDKQVFGRVGDVVFGTLSRIDNIPKSRVYGVEGEATWRIVRSLTLRTTGVYLNSKIKQYTAPNELGVVTNFSGRPFAYTPKFQGNAAIMYDSALTDDLRMDAQVDGSYQSSSNASFAQSADFRIRAYGIVNAAFGISSTGKRWRVGLYGRNLAKKYYWNGVASATDTIFRFPGMAREYGVRTSFKL